MAIWKRNSCLAIGLIVVVASASAIILKCTATDPRDIRRERPENPWNVAAAEQLVREQPYDPSAHSVLSSALMDEKRYVEASKEMERAVSLHPKDAALRYYFAEALWAAGRHREAREQWQLAVKYDDAVGGWPGEYGKDALERYK